MEITVFGYLGRCEHAGCRGPAFHKDEDGYIFCCTHHDVHNEVRHVICKYCLQPFMAHATGNLPKRCLPCKAKNDREYSMQRYYNKKVLA